MKFLIQIQLNTIIKILFLIFFFFKTTVGICLEKKELSLPKRIEIDIPKSKIKSYFKNMSNAQLDGDTEEKKNIRRKYKKWWDAKFQYEINNKQKIQEGRIRLMGDWKDHLDLPRTSLKIKISEGTIGGIKRFKLLLPITRFKEKEIFFTILLRHLGYLAPDTRYINVKTNFSEYEALFQEDTEKEFLERSGYVETPIIKQNEMFFEKSKKTKAHLNKLKKNPLMFSYIVDNKNFLKKTNSEVIVSNAITLMHHLRSSVNTNDTYFFYNEKAFLKIMNKYAKHGTQKHNRRFLFDPILQLFYPIYYDGNVKYPKLKDFKNNICNQKTYLDEIKSIRKEYESKSKKNLSAVEICIINDVFNIFNKNKETSKELKSDIKNKINQSQAWVDKKNQIISYFMNGRPVLSSSKQGPRYTFILNDKSFICFFSKNYISINYCEELKLKKYKKLISNNTRLKLFDNIQFPTINLGNLNYMDFFKNNIEILKINSEVKSQIFNLKEEKNYFLNQDIRKKKLIFNFMNSKSRVIFLSDISHSFIEFNFDKTKEFYFSRIQKNNNISLTGCATFLNSKINDLKIRGLNGFCEDAVNFINVIGRNIDINLKNSKTDAFDADFSKISFNNLKINTAGNDCADFSFGKYSISNSNLSNCNDKAFSLGETSNVSVNNAEITNSLTAIAVKDQARLNLKNSSASNVKNCISIYKKKEEFNSGSAFIDNYQCDGKYNVDKNGILKIVK